MTLLVARARHDNCDNADICHPRPWLIAAKRRLKRRIGGSRDQPYHAVLVLEIFLHGRFNRAVIPGALDDHALTVRDRLVAPITDALKHGPRRVENVHAVALHAKAEAVPDRD